MKSGKQSIKPAPPASTWCFDGLPENEEWPCYYYEYYREDAAIRAEIIAARQLPQDEQESGLELSANFVCAQIAQGEPAHRLFSLVPKKCVEEFPMTPWKQILPSRRAAIINALAGIEKSIYEPWGQQRFRKFAQLLSESRTPTMDSAGEPMAFAVIPLDWNLSDANLENQFKAFLVHRPRPKQKTGGRRIPSDGLHALGMMRLQKYYGGPSAFMKAIDAGVVNVQYNSVRAIHFVVSSAETIARNLHSFELG